MEADAVGRPTDPPPQCPNAPTPQRPATDTGGDGAHARGVRCALLARQYNEMLQQRMAEEDALRQKLTAEAEAINGTLQPRLDAALERAGELERQLTAEKGRADAALTAEAQACAAAAAHEREAAMSEAEASSLRAELARHADEIDAVRKAAEGARQKSELAKAEMLRVRAAAEASLSAKAEAEARCQQLEEALARARAEAEAHRADAERGLAMSQVRNAPLAMNPVAKARFRANGMAFAAATPTAAPPPAHLSQAPSSKHGAMRAIPANLALPHALARALLHGRCFTGATHLRAPCDAFARPLQLARKLQGEMEALEASRREALETLRQSEADANSAAAEAKAAAEAAAAREAQAAIALEAAERHAKNEADRAIVLYNRSVESEEQNKRLQVELEGFRKARDQVRAHPSRLAGRDPGPWRLLCARPAGGCAGCALCAR